MTRPDSDALGSPEEPAAADSAQSEGPDPSVPADAAATDSAQSAGPDISAPAAASADAAAAPEIAQSSGPAPLAPAVATAIGAAGAEIAQSAGRGTSAAVAASPARPEAPAIVPKRKEPSRLWPCLWRFLRATWSWFWDRLWPSLDCQSKAEKATELRKQEGFLKSSHAAVDNCQGQPTDRLEAVLDDTVRLLEREREKRVGVEARLTSVLGYGSVVGTVVLALLTTQSFRILEAQTGSHFSTVVGKLVLVLVGYVAAQLLCALLAATRGLERVAILSIKPSEVGHEPGESPEARLLRQIRLHMNCIHDYSIANQRKVSQMAVCHTALKNFYMGMLLLIAGALARNVSSSLELGAALSRQIREDAALRDALRGARGDRGAEGSRGEPGPPGPPGRDCPAPEVKKAVEDRGAKRQ